MKKYVRLEELNENEKRTGVISYKRLIDRISENLILCNNIVSIDDSIFYNIEVGSLYYDEEMEQEKDIYQCFIIDVDNYTLKKLQELKCDDVIIAYSQALENYILLVDHFGTSWDYVETGIGFTDDIMEADL